MPKYRQVKYGGGWKYGIISLLLHLVSKIRSHLRLSSEIKGGIVIASEIRTFLKISSTFEAGINLVSDCRSALVLIPELEGAGERV